MLLQLFLVRVLVFFFHDLKRVIAFSTCSQLGYMILACGLERFNVAFFHLITHAFFKALLFLTAGAIIHSMFDEQDIRKFGSKLKYLPLTYICFLIGSLNLIGFPFLSGFFSKDLLLELVYSSFSTIGFYSYSLGTLSIFFTAAYSTRILLLIFLIKINNNRYSIKNTFENSFFIKYPLIILSLFSVLIGYLSFDIFCGLGSNFFGTSFFFNINTYNQLDIEFLPTLIKLFPLIVTFLGCFFSVYLYMLYIFLFFLIKKNRTFKYFYFFLLKKWYSDRFINYFFTLFFLKISKKYMYNKLDRGLLEIFGPFLIYKSLSSLNRTKLYFIE